MTDEVAEKEEKGREREDSSVNLCAFYGVKSGMARIFDEEGNHVPVTVIKLIPNYISQVKTLERDGYEAYQIVYGEKGKKSINKPMAGVLYKAGITDFVAHFSELAPLDSVEESHVGKLISMGLKQGSYVDIRGVSKGKGFQGVMKRFGFKGGPKSHGSKFHRTGGSIGNRATPGRVWKNKKMPGRMGGLACTVQNLKVVEMNCQDGYLLVKGMVPGSKNSYVKVMRSTKKREEG